MTVRALSIFEAGASLTVVKIGSTTLIGVTHAVLLLSLRSKSNSGLILSQILVVASLRTVHVKVIVTCSICEPSLSLLLIVPKSKAIV